MQESRIHFYDLTVILLRTLAALALPPTTCVVRLLGDRITVEQMSNKASTGKVDPNSYRIFVGGLRKTTTEDRIHAHFARFGEVQVVEIKRQPDGTSRGFAFVRFARLDSVDRAIEAHAQHMIDNKWVDVKRHDNDAHSAGPASAYRDDRERKKKQATASSDDDAVDDRKAARSMLQQSMKNAMGQVDSDEKAEKGMSPAMMMGMMSMMNPMMMASMNPMMAMNMMGMQSRSEGDAASGQPKAGSCAQSNGTGNFGSVQGPGNGANMRVGNCAASTAPGGGFVGGSTEGGPVSSKSGRSAPY
eukprot:s400_g32.t2